MSQRDDEETDDLEVGSEHDCSICYKTVIVYIHGNPENCDASNSKVEEERRPNPNENAADAENQTDSKVHQELNEKNTQGSGPVDYDQGYQYQAETKEEQFVSIIKKVESFAEKFCSLTEYILEAFCWPVVHPPVSPSFTHDAPSLKS